MITSNGKVTLRRLRPSDAQRFAAYRNDPDIARYQSWEHMDDVKTLHFLEHCHSVDPLLQPGQWTQIAVADAVSDALFGDMGIFLSSEVTEAELGITLAKHVHRKGIATQAMRLAMDFVFDETPVSRIICGADARNTASLHLIQKLGFAWTHREVLPGGEVDEMYKFLKLADVP